MANEEAATFSGMALEAFREGLLRIARRRIPRGLRVDLSPEDAVQLAYTVGWQKREKFLGKSAGQLFGWHKTILENAIKNEIKKLEAQKRGFARPLELVDRIVGTSEHFIDRVRGPARGQSSDTGRRNLRKAIRPVLDRLPSRQRDAVEYFYLQRFSYKEIAARMNTTTNAVARLLDRARGNLARFVVALRRDLSPVASPVSVLR